MKIRFGTLMFPVHLTMALLLVGLLPSTATATNLTLNSFSASPSPLKTGDTSTWTLGIGIDAAKPGEQFSSANLTFTSGDGQSASFSGALSGSSASIGQSFAYGSAGTYFGSVSGSVVGSWQQYDPTYGYIPVYGWVQTGSDCNWLGSCSPINTWEQIGSEYGVTGHQWQTHTETFGIDGSGSAQLSTSWQTSYTYGYTVWDYAWVTHYWTTPGPCLFNCSGSYTTWDAVGAHTEYNTIVTDHTQTLAVDGLTVSAAVPEPQTYAMMLAGLGLLAIAPRRRKQTA